MLDALTDIGGIPYRAAGDVEWFSMSSRADFSALSTVSAHLRFTATHVSA